MLASLPMLDFPAHADTTSAFWAAIATALRQRGIDAPDQLTRAPDLMAQWQSPDLLLSQTCGMPFVRHLRGKVRLVAGVAYDLPDLRPGTYCSRIILRADAPETTLEDLRGRRVAFNSADSQSGAGALRRLILPLVPPGGAFFGQAVPTGAHVASIRAVAEGRADVAAIDAVTFAFAQRYIPAAQNVRVLMSTDLTPGLPLITANDGPAEPLFHAIAEALDQIGPEARRVLLINGIVPRADADYDGIADWDQRARAHGYCDLEEPAA